MQLQAVRYGIAHPVGTGIYDLSGVNPGPDIDPDISEYILTHSPHNQFLNSLVFYGIPGLVLSLMFYGIIFESVKAALRMTGSLARDRYERRLLVGLAGGIVAYVINSLFHNGGPFVGDWFHFYLVGLIFSVYRILYHDTKALKEVAQVNDMRIIGEGLASQ